MTDDLKQYERTSNRVEGVLPDEWVKTGEPMLEQAKTADETAKAILEGDYDLVCEVIRDAEQVRHLEAMARLWRMRDEILQVSKEIATKIEANSYCESWQQHRFDDYLTPLKAIVEALDSNDAQ